MKFVAGQRVKVCRGSGIRAQKWQSRKDSNLDKVNQNHLCYHYTTGLHASQPKQNFRDCSIIYTRISLFSSPRTEKT